MPATTRAIVQTGPRQLELRDLPIPDIDDESGLLRVEACGIYGSDVEQYTGALPVRWPLIPGHEPLGIIEKIGDRAAQRWGVNVGDRLYSSRGTDPLRPLSGEASFVPASQAPLAGVRLSTLPNSTTPQRDAFAIERGGVPPEALSRKINRPAIKPPQLQTSLRDMGDLYRRMRARCRFQPHHQPSRISEAERCDGAQLKADAAIE